MASCAVASVSMARNLKLKEFAACRSRSSESVESQAVSSCGASSDERDGRAGDVPGSFCDASSPECSDAECASNTIEHPSRAAQAGTLPTPRSHSSTSDDSCDEDDALPYTFSDCFTGEERVLTKSGDGRECLHPSHDDGAGAVEVTGGSGDDVCVSPCRIRHIDGWITPNQVLDHLYLGSAADAHRIDHLHRLGITHIVNVSCMDNFWPDSFTYLKIDILDSPFVSIRKHFAQCQAFIEEARAKGGKCLVHCQMGLSRSPTLCVSYLMAAQKLDLKRAYEFVFNARGVITPNDGFYRQLIDFERELFGCISVSMNLSQRCVTLACDTESDESDFDEEDTTDDSDEDERDVRSRHRKERKGKGGRGKGKGQREGKHKTKRKSKRGGGGSSCSVM